MTRVLVVEDDADSCALLTRWLREDGLEVDAVDTGERGLTLLREGRYDLALVDLRLPGVNGYELVRRLDPKETPTIIMTVADREEFPRNVPVGAWLAKPYTRRAVRKAVDRARKSRDA